jgi:hypothetical protein
VDKHHRRAGGNREQHLPGLARAAARGLKGCGERAEDTDRDQRFLDEQGVGGVPSAGARAEYGAEGESPEGGKERRAEPDCAGGRPVQRASRGISGGHVSQFLSLLDPSSSAR